MAEIRFLIFTIKILQIRTPEKIVGKLRSNKVALTYSNASKNADGMANSVNPDQTAPVAADLGLHYLPRPSFPKT